MSLTPTIKTANYKSQRYACFQYGITLNSFTPNLICNQQYLDHSYTPQNDQYVVSNV